MRGERQDDEFGQALTDWVALNTTEFDGRADEISATLRINFEPMGPATGKNRSVGSLSLKSAAPT